MANQISLGLGGVPYYQLPVQEEKASIIEEFQQLRLQYEVLFRAESIIEIFDSFLTEMPDVEMDHYLFVSSREHSFIGISGVGPCHAVCASGKTEEGEVFLG